MEVLAATPSASSASIEKPKSPEQGFDKALDRARSDTAPPGSPPPNKETNTQAGEVAGSEQKSPPQQLDSQPEQGKSTTQAASLNPALLVALVSVSAPSLADAAKAPETAAAAQAAAQAATVSGVLTASQTKGTAGAPGTTDPKAAGPTDGDGPDDESSEQGSEGSKGISVQSVAHPDLGKVKIKLQKLAANDAQAESDLAKADADKDTAVSGTANLAEPKSDGTAGALTLTTPKPLAPTVAAPTAQPLSNEHRDMVYRQVADRMELLAASRPQEAVTIHLQPQDLGDVTVVIKNAGVKMSAEFFATHDGVRDALKQDSSKLTEQLQAKGVAMTHIAVSQSSQSQQTGSNTHYRDRQSAQGQANAQSHSDAQAQQRNQREASKFNFSPSSLKETKTAQPRHWSRRSTAVDLSI